MSLFLCAVLIFTTGGSAVRAADETGLQIQYDPATTIHSIGSGDDTLILFCMNNALHWPHTTDAITSVPATGDHSHMGLFGLIMAVCAAAITVNLVLRRRSREK